MQAKKPMHEKGDLKRAMSARHKQKLSQIKNRIASRANRETRKAAENKSLTLNASVSQANLLTQTQPSKGFENRSFSQTSNMYSNFNQNLKDENKEVNEQIASEYGAMVGRLDKSNRDLIAFANESVSAFATLTENGMRAANYVFIDLLRRSESSAIESALDRAKDLVTQMTEMDARKAKDDDFFAKLSEEEKSQYAQQFEENVREEEIKRNDVFKPFYTPSEFLDPSLGDLCAFDDLAPVIGQRLPGQPRAEDNSVEPELIITLLICKHCDGGWQGPCRDTSSVSGLGYLESRYFSYKSTSVRILSFLQYMGFGLSKVPNKENTYLVYFSCLRSKKNSLETKMGDKSHWCKSIYAGDETNLTVSGSPHLSKYDGVLGFFDVKNLDNEPAKEEDRNYLKRIYRNAWYKSLDGFANNGIYKAPKNTTSYGEFARKALNATGRAGLGLLLSPLSALGIPTGKSLASGDIDYSSDLIRGKCIPTAYMSDISTVNYTMYNTITSQELNMSPYIPSDKPSAPIDPKFFAHEIDTIAMVAFPQANLGIKELGDHDWCSIFNGYVRNRKELDDSFGSCNPENNEGQLALINYVTKKYFLKAEGYLNSNSIYNLFPIHKDFQVQCPTAPYNGSKKYPAIINISEVLNSIANKFKEHKTAEEDVWFLSDGIKFGADQGAGFHNLLKICGLDILDVGGKKDYQDILAASVLKLMDIVDSEGTFSDGPSTDTITKEQNTVGNTMESTCTKLKAGVKPLSHTALNKWKLRQLAGRIDRLGRKNRNWWVGYLCEKHQRIQHFLRIHDAKLRAEKERSSGLNLVGALDLTAENQDFNESDLKSWDESLLQLKTMDWKSFNGNFNKMDSNAGNIILAKYLELFETANYLNEQINAASVSAPEGPGPAPAEQAKIDLISEIMDKFL